MNNNLPNKGTIASPPNAVFENEKKNQKEDVRKKQEVSKGESETNQEMSRQEFERLLMKIKLITFGIMGNIRWDKVKLKFWKNEEDKETALLTFEVEKRGCFIEFIVSEKSKQEFLRTDAFKIVESFITQHLVNYGKNGYLEDKCPECKQTTLTKTSVKNDPGEEAVACILCGWAGFMVTYNEYLNDKKNKPFLEFPEWLDKRNRWWAK